jgi:hypothetical protein
MSGKESNAETRSFFVRLLLAVVLIAAVFLLGQDMVARRFFRGGWVNQRVVLKR